MFESIIVLLAGLYLFMIGTWLSTENFRSFFVFKFIPITLGIFNIVYSLSLFGFIRWAM